MRNLTQSLIAEERRRASPSDAAGHAAFRVCEKLRRPLSTFAGVGGHRSLLSRALALAKAEAPFLDGMQIKLDGSFQYSPEMEAQLDTNVATQAATVLTDQLLGLLVTFIGEALTLRLVHDVWPKAAMKDSKSGEKSP
jgi:hypothetical protein